MVCSFQVIREPIEVPFIRLSKWFSVRLDDFLDGIPLARAYITHYQNKKAAGKLARRRFYVFLQRILFDGETLGVATNPWNALIPRLGVGKSARDTHRPSKYVRQRLDAGNRIVYLYACHIQCK